MALMRSAPSYDAGLTTKIFISGTKQPNLNSPSWCKWFLLDLVKEIRMTPVKGGGCEIQIPSPLGKSKSGVSATRIILESHVAIHTWPEQEALRLLVDSCREFDIDHLLRYLEYVFDTPRIVIRKS